MTGDKILRLENIQKRYGNVVVLKGVTASVITGAITAFMGPNGAGKTTLFHTITGDLRLDQGKVFFRGQSIGGKPPWRVARLGLGKLFQDVRVFDSLTVLENVLLALHGHAGRSVFSAPIRVYSNGRLKAEAEKWLEEAGVEKPYDRPAEELSFGNKKLLALARLMAGEFDLLLLDEPAAGLSPPLIHHVQGLLKRMVHEQKKTVALIEHNFTFVKEIADETYVLCDGEVYDYGATDDVLNRKENREVLIGL